MIRTQDIRYSYDGIRQMQFPDIHCDSGEGVLVLGPSGSGKTTMLHIMAGLLKPKSGSVEINKTSLYEKSNSEIRRIRSNEIGIVFQVPHFISALSMMDNLLLSQKLAGRKIHKREVEDYFAELNIGHRLNARPSELSQGELQRASLVRAIINEPSVIFADEPTSALDDESAARVSGLLKKYAEQNGSALIVVTHDHRIGDMLNHKVELSKIRE